MESPFLSDFWWAVPTLRVARSRFETNPSKVDLSVAKLIATEDGAKYDGQDALDDLLLARTPPALVSRELVRAELGGWNRRSA